MPDSTSLQQEEDVFPGFPRSLADGYTQIPNVWFEILMRITNLAEFKVTLYVARHTWGFRDEDGDRDEFKKITIDEFAYGRKLKDGTRFDSGTGLGLTAVKDGLKRATSHGYLVYDVDDTDLARIKKYYSLKFMEEENEEEESDGHVPASDSRNPTTDSHNPTSQGQNATTGGMNSDRRSEKETPDEINLQKETERERALSRSQFFDQALKFVREKKQVNFFELEKYMHRFIRVRGREDITLSAKNLVAWSGSSNEFVQVVLALQEYHSHVKLVFCKERAYSDKGRKPRHPLSTGASDYEEKHWQPMLILYTDDSD